MSRFLVGPADLGDDPYVGWTPTTEAIAAIGERLWPAASRTCETHGSVISCSVEIAGDAERWLHIDVTLAISTVQLNGDPDLVRAWAVEYSAALPVGQPWYFSDDMGNRIVDVRADGDAGIDWVLGRLPEFVPTPQPWFP